MTDPAPAVLFTYRRPEHVRKTLEALKQNPEAKDTQLIVYSDASDQPETAEDVRRVREILHTTNGFRGVRIHERKTRYGLAKNILSGVSEVLEEFGKVIVLEDDLITHPAFLRYMNGALNTYTSDSRILSVSASMPHRLRMRVPKRYPQDVWLSRRNLSTGWGTWRDKWTTVDWEIGDLETFRNDPDAQRRFNLGGADLTPAFLNAMDLGLDLWAARFSYAHFVSGRFSVLPRRSYVKHIGYDGSGMNAFRNPFHWLDRFGDAVEHPVFPETLDVDEDLQRRFRNAFRSQGWIEQLRRRRVLNGIHSS
jgi:hypothetical protein